MNYNIQSKFYKTKLPEKRTIVSNLDIFIKKTNLPDELYNNIL